MNNARKIIGDWKRLIKVYRSESEKLAKEYIQLTKNGSEDHKIALIEAFGNKYLIVKSSLIVKY